MFSKKFASLLVCMGTLSHSMDTPETQVPKKQSLYLVVGSTRKTTLTNSFPQEQLWSESNADFSHATTYKRRATTMDLRACNRPNTQHIIADARNYDFSNHIIRAAYLERLPTLDCTGKGNYLGKCIQNAAKAMKQGAKLEIEWHPYAIFPTKGTNTVKSVLYRRRMTSNPFTAAINAGLVCASIQMACGIPIPDDMDCPKRFRTCTQKLSKTLETLIDFYAEKNLGTKDELKKRIMKELWLWTELERTDQLALLSHGPTASLENFANAIKQFYRVDKKISLFEQIMLQSNGYRLYDANAVLTDSLFCLMLCDAAIIHGQKYAKTFMRNNGFKNVSIKRTTSKRNGRTNVWIIEATKA